MLCAIAPIAQLGSCFAERDERGKTTEMRTVQAQEITFKDLLMFIGVEPLKLRWSRLNISVLAKISAMPRGYM
ncbi:MAG: hypothetical protein CMK72_02530 [Pseudomonadaceae bacterium]|nr:hypothetical protein [Pseudomonadaceae bacterium]